MADAYTSTGVATLGTDLVKTAYDRLVEFELRAQPILRAMADKQPAQQAMPGSSIVMQFYNDLAATTSALSEEVDPDATAVPSTSSVTVSLAEYGAAVLVTRKLQLVSLSDVDEGIANIVAYHMRDSLDEIVRPTLTGGTNVVRYNSGTLQSNLVTAGAGNVNLVTATDTYASALSRFAVSKLRGAKVIPRQGDLYGIWLHPDVSHDLRSETGSAGWREPHNFSGPESIWQGNIGVYEGAYYIESPRMYYAADGATSTRVYRSLAMGRQALAEAVAEEPHMVVGNVTDKLMRHRPVGWYGMLGWARYREDALIRIETASSIA